MKSHEDARDGLHVASALDLDRQQAPPAEVARVSPHNREDEIMAIIVGDEGNNTLVGIEGEDNLIYGDTDGQLSGATSHTMGGVKSGLPKSTLRYRYA